MNKLFTQELIRMLSIAGIAGISLSALLGARISKAMGSFAPFRKATVVYLLVCVLIFGVIGFAGVKFIFIYPATTLACCQLIFCALGFLHIRYMHRYLKWSGQPKSFWFEVLFTVITAAFGFMSFLIIFTWMNKAGYQYYMASSVLFFIIAYFIYTSFLRAVSIPVKIYNRWFYPVHEEVEDPEDSELKNMLVISFEFQKKITDPHFTNFRAKAPSDMQFGQLFYYFINDYNERHPNEKIEFVNIQGAPYGWMFYKKPKWYYFGMRYIDTGNTFFINHIKENDIIVCTRV